MFCTFFLDIMQVLPEM